MCKWTWYFIQSIMPIVICSSVCIDTATTYFIRNTWWLIILIYDDIPQWARLIYIIHGQWWILIGAETQGARGTWRSESPCRPPILHSRATVQWSIDDDFIDPLKWLGIARNRTILLYGIGCGQLLNVGTSRRRVVGIYPVLIKTIH